MAHEHSPDEAVELWQSQKVEPVMMTIDEIRSKAVKFERKIRSRNLRETIGSLVAIVVFAYFLHVYPSPVARLGSLLAIVGLGYVIWRMNGKAAPGRVPSNSAFDTCIAFHRHELERQRDMLLTVWRWYLAPLVPGLVVFSLAIIAPKVRHPLDWWKAVPGLAIMVLWFWVAVRLNARAAACLQRQIDELASIGQR